MDLKEIAELERLEREATPGSGKLPKDFWNDCLLWDGATIATKEKVQTDGVPDMLTYPEMKARRTARTKEE